MKNEKRKYVRITINQVIQITYGKETSFHVSAANLSEGGILCEATEPLEPYTRTYVMFDIPVKSGTHNICCEGIVVRSEKKKGKNLIGIEFSNLSDEDREYIKKLVNEK